MKPVPLYDTLATDYDRFVNWEGRLAHELPFFCGLFEAHGVYRVLDTACGTGQHAIALAKEGCRVHGTDLSGAMVARARENAAAAGVEVPFSQLGFGELDALGGTFDAVLCVGNSLPHLLTEAAVDMALAEFASVLEPGGLLVIQNRNFDQVWSQRQRFMEPQSYRDDDQELIFSRFYDFHDETATFNMIRLRRSGQGWVQDVESTVLRPIFADHLTVSLEAKGFGGILLFGGYDSSEFDPCKSGDLIAVAKRRSA
jgi:SAM-dependent methyltransferase